MGISDELRDLAATPPEATALSASLADQAVGFAVRARRVAHMKIAAAAAAGAIAATGVGIGLLNSNNDPALPTTTPVVTITPNPSSASQTSASSSSPSQSATDQPDATSESTSQAPAPVQPDTPEQPGPDKNIIEKIIDTVTSIPQRIADFFQPDRSPSAEPSPSAPSASPSQSPTSPPSDSSSAPSTAEPSSTPTSSPSKSNSEAAPSSSSPEIECWIERVEGEGGSSESKQVSCEKYLPTPGADSSRRDSSSARSSPTSPTCTLVVRQEGRDDVRHQLDQCPSLEK